MLGVCIKMRWGGYGQAFIANSSRGCIVLEMAEGKGTHTAEQEKESTKRPPWWKRLWEWTEFGKKSGWNWLELLSALAIPVVLAVIGFWFTAQQDARQQQIEDQRAKLERELEEQRAQDAALQAYFDQMGALMLDRDLRSSAGGDEVRLLARARTVTILRRLDPVRNRDILQFLREARLTTPEEPILEFTETNLSEADLRAANLESFDLEHTDLSDADLRDANLSYAYLHDTNLERANLQGANLKKANLSDANLSEAKVTDEQLAEAQSLQGATMPDGSKHP
jgi:uncharacterized protein YjbI with pentapeptide repeats